jgi:hypothetical protein
MVMEREKEVVSHVTILRYYILPFVYERERYLEKLKHAYLHLREFEQHHFSEIPQPLNHEPSFSPKINKFLICPLFTIHHREHILKTVEDNVENLD